MTPSETKRVESCFLLYAFVRLIVGSVLKRLDHIARVSAEVFFNGDPTSQAHESIIMKQLDVDVSPPAFLWNSYLALVNGAPPSPHKIGQDMNFFLVIFFLVFWHRRTEGDA